MKRRDFLARGAVGSLVLGSSGGYLAFAENDDRALALFLHRIFPDARLAAQDEEEFIRRASLELTMAGAKRKLANALLSSEAMVGLARLIGDNHLDYQGKLVSLFFRSTDYADPNRPPGTVTLLAFADPYEAGCANPLPALLEQNLEWPPAPPAKPA